MDRDIQGSVENLKVAEEIVKHKWKWDGEKYKNPSRHNDVVPYYLEDSKLDHDIVDS